MAGDPALDGVRLGPSGQPGQLQVPSGLAQEEPREIYSWNSREIPGRGQTNRTVATIEVAFLADFLHACENSLEEDREICKIEPRPILKALSWLGRNADVSALQPLLQASLIRAFLTQPTSDRKEALPMPLAVVVEWEKYICSPIDF